ncbi:MAG TPA: class E sortase, partial [Verrucomicrobiae bacterium]|nr:class E sortase [Verrucomicrobiae bacterium]
AMFHLENHGTKQKQLLAEVQAKASPHTSQAPGTPAGNRVIIPSMLLDQPILEGSIANQYKTLNQGIWRWPRGSTPDKGGNTTLIGHRFTYTNPRGVFYFLNKVKIGDEIGILWNNHKYVYKVATITEVSPHDTKIEDSTTNSELTLFTCTPLWLPKDRLVIVANEETAT